LRRLRHPNIVDVTDFGYAEADGRRVAYLVMEYLDGCSLADVLRDDAQLPWPGWPTSWSRRGRRSRGAPRGDPAPRPEADNIWLEPNRRAGTR